MFDFSSVSSVLSLLFEGIYVVFGVIVLVLTAVVAAGRKGLVATGGVLLGIGALGDVVAQAWIFYSADIRMMPPEAFILPTRLHDVFVFVFIGGLIALVLAATKPSTEQAATAPPPPPSHPGPRPFPTR